MPTNRERLQSAISKSSAATTEAAARKAMRDAFGIYLTPTEADATVEAIRRNVPVALNKMKLPLGVLSVVTRYRLVVTAKPANGGRSAGVRRIAAEERISKRQGAPKCSECGGKLDAVSADYLRRYPNDYRSGILGSCCASKSSWNGRGDDSRE